MARRRDAQIRIATQLIKEEYQNSTAPPPDTKIDKILKNLIQGYYVHGTMRGYNQYGCRCIKCKIVAKKYYKQWREKNPEKRQKYLDKAKERRRIAKEANQRSKEISA